MYSSSFVCLSIKYQAYIGDPCAYFSWLSAFIFQNFISIEYCKTDTTKCSVSSQLTGYDDMCDVIPYKHARLSVQEMQYCISCDIFMGKNYITFVIGYKGHL